MCWETVLQYCCGCQELQDIRMCEHAVFPWIVNIAHPKNQPAQPTVSLQHSAEECKQCRSKKGKAKVLAPGEKERGLKAAAAPKKIVVYEDEDDEGEYDGEYEKNMAQRKILKATGSRKGKGKSADGK